MGDDERAATGLRDAPGASASPLRLRRYRLLLATEGATPFPARSFMARPLHLLSQETGVEGLEPRAFEEDRATWELHGGHS